MKNDDDMKRFAEQLAADGVFMRRAQKSTQGVSSDLHFEADALKEALSDEATKNLVIVVDNPVQGLVAKRQAVEAGRVVTILNNYHKDVDVEERTAKVESFNAAEAGTAVLISISPASPTVKKIMATHPEIRDRISAIDPEDDLRPE